ncbi:MAG: thiamine phosphate synthase [Bacteroidales bacterium]|nr:thiamine phosphate synthase [Bacteroidales bacterium]
MRTPRPHFVPLDLSPAVERAAEAARVTAERLGSPVIRHADWFLGLLGEEDGKPIRLLAEHGVDRENIRTSVEALATNSPPVLMEALYTAAQELAVTLRGDATLTTDFVLLATLEADAALRSLLADHGLPMETLRRALLSPDIELPTPAESPASSASAPPVTATMVPSAPATEPPTATDRVILESVDPRPGAARIVDANGNRAREAIRVIEDYCRFVLNHRALASQMKSLRHRLADAVARLPGSLLLMTRDTLGDVGTTITTEAEYHRESLACVATANLKRLQEALRSVEEYGKILDPDFARLIEPLRYETYTLERELLIVAAGDRRAQLAHARLYLLIAERNCAFSLERTIQEAAEGGVDVVQLREKKLPDAELRKRAAAVRRWTRDAGVLFIVNDRPDIARLVEADGVHLGQDDLSVADARKIVGPDLLIGVSTHNPRQVQTATTAGADYLGVGPTFPSRTKSFSEYPGLPFVQAATTVATLPAFILGGINATNIAEVIAAGGQRVAVSAAITTSPQPREAAQSLRAALASSQVIGQ